MREKEWAGQQRKLSHSQSGHLFQWSKHRKTMLHCQDWFCCQQAWSKYWNECCSPQRAGKDRNCVQSAVYSSLHYGGNQRPAGSAKFTRSCETDWKRNVLQLSPELHMDPSRGQTGWWVLKVKAELKLWQTMVSLCAEDPSAAGQSRASSKPLSSAVKRSGTDVVMSLPI